MANIVSQDKGREMIRNATTFMLALLQVRETEEPELWKLQNHMYDSLSAGINYMGEYHLGKLKKKLIHKVISQAFAAIWKVFCDQGNKDCTPAELLALCLTAGKINHEAIALKKQTDYNDLPLLVHIDMTNGKLFGTIEDENNNFWAVKQTQLREEALG